MTLYAANSNGDWWEVSNGGGMLWLLDTDNLPANLLRDYEQEKETDKFHRFIWEHGEAEIIGDN